MGNDFPDVVIGKFGFTGLLEIKTPPDRDNKQRKGLTAGEQLSIGQRRFADEWRGMPVIVAYDVATVDVQFRALMQRTLGLA